MRENQRPRRSAPQRAIFDAVTPELVQGAARLWSKGSPAPVAIPAVQNFVYAVERKEGPAIMRLTHESHRSEAEVAGEVSWLIDLKQRGLPVPAVYPSLQDKLVQTVESDQGRFVITCFERLSGVEPDPGQHGFWSDQIFEVLGAMMARLHQASYEAAWNPATLTRRGWREESVAQNFHFYVPVNEKAVHEAFDRVLAKLDALPRSRDSFGLIHADLNHANFFVTQAGLNIFDFDDSCYCWFAYDLLVPIFHFPAAEPEVMNTQAQRALRSLVRGYESVGRFNPAWLELLPLLFKWRDLITYGFFYEQLEIDELPERMSRTFLAMRARIESDRPIAEIGDAR
ncbi:MAG: phosphotransferase [Verrucomicrobiota bacterium]|nr:phosphotransferase [Verrucomicrobiota bacterium]